MTDITAILARLREAGLHRRLRPLSSGPGSHVSLDGRRVVLLCSNDYLGLAGDPRVREAAAAGAREWGAGAGASRLISGDLTLHHELEQELARFKGYEACLLFGSGYLANTGVIAALAGPGDVILSDAHNHASIIDGCRQSRAQTIVYEHCDLDSLAAGLAQAHGRPALIVTDAVFSMDGDLAPLNEMVTLAQAYGARMLVDEAHATGVIGSDGRGLVSALGLESEVDVVIGTLGKALGSYGAFACSNRTTADFLVNRARTLIYSTALPPASIAAALCALRILNDAPELVARLHANARLLRGELRERGFAVSLDPMPIVPLLIGSPSDATSVSEAALRDGILAQAIRPPTVPDGTSRLRLVATAAHAEEDLIRSAAILADAVVALVGRTAVKGRA